MITDGIGLRPNIGHQIIEQSKEGNGQSKMTFQTSVNGVTRRLFFLQLARQRHRIYVGWNVLPKKGEIK